MARRGAPGGDGYLETMKTKNAVKIHFRGKFCILYIINLINGKFRTPRIRKLHALVSYINTNWIDTIDNPILLLPKDNSSLDSNGWLTGFSEGDASLGINITWPSKSKNGYGQIRLMFEIVQTFAPRGALVY